MAVHVHSVIKGQAFMSTLFGPRMRLGLLVGILTGIAIWTWFQSPGRHGKLPYGIRAETTIFTEPLREDGTVDLVSVVNQQLAARVPVDDNALVDLATVLDARLVSVEDVEQFWNILGTEPVHCSNPLPTRQSLYSRLERTISDEEQVKLAAEFESASKTPWTEADYPLLPEILETLEPDLKEIRDITRRKQRYFSPFIVSADTGANGVAMGYNFAVADAVRTFGIRAMHRIGIGKYDEALDDLLTMNVMHGYVGQSHAQPDIIFLFATRQWIFYVERSLFGKTPLTRKQLQHYQQIVEGLPAQLDFSTRWPALKLLAVDMMQNQATQPGLPDWLRKGDLESFGNFERARKWIDYDAALKSFVQATEKLEPVFKRFNPKSDFVDFNQVHEEIDNRWWRMRGRFWNVYCLRISSAEYRGHVFGIICAQSLFGPIPLAHFFTFERKAAQLRVLSQVAVALELFKLDNGHYPDELTKLVPNYLNVEPLDLFTMQPLRAEATPEKYLVYSLWTDKMDNRGRRNSTVPIETYGDQAIWSEREPEQLTVEELEVIHREYIDNRHLYR